MKRTCLYSPLTTEYNQSFFASRYLWGYNILFFIYLSYLANRIKLALSTAVLRNSDLYVCEYIICNEAKGQIRKVQKKNIGREGGESKKMCGDWI